MFPRLERYEITDRIAEGGMGEVFRGSATGEHGFTKPVAIKRVRPELGGDETFVIRLVAEAKLAVTLAHANVVQVLDLCRNGEDLFLIMEYVAGANLADLGRAAAMTGRRFTPSEVVYLGLEALQGLAYAHERIDERGRAAGIIHCDICLQNLLVSYSGELKVADFGVALLKTEASRLQQAVLGKVSYMAPERLAGRPFDARSDLYSLGVVLMELLSGHRMSASQDTGVIAEERLSGLAAAYDLERDDVPPQLDRLLRQLVAVDPGRRPPSAVVALSQLTSVAALLPAITAPEMGALVRALVPPGAMPRNARSDSEADALLAPERTGTESRALIAGSFIAHNTTLIGTPPEPAFMAPPDRPKRSAAAFVLGVLGAIAVVGAFGWTVGHRTLVPTAVSIADPVAPANVDAQPRTDRVVSRELAAPPLVQPVAPTPAPAKLATPSAPARGRGDTKSSRKTPQAPNRALIRARSPQEDAPIDPFH